MDMGDSTSDTSDGENSAVFHLYSLGSRGQLRGRVSGGTIFSILKCVGGTEILLCARTPSLTNIILFLQSWYWPRNWNLHAELVIHCGKGIGPIA